MNKEQGEFIKHIPCDECSSSDGRALYSTGTSYCFVCQNWQGNKEMEQEFTEEKESVGNFVSVEFKDLVKRKISERTLRKFNYGIANGKHVANYYNKEGKRVAQKFRDKDKKFAWLGDTKSSTLFGQHVFTPNQKLRIVLTEGEIDALSIAEIQDCKYPVVSVPNGAPAAVKDVKKNLEYLMGFEEVLICFDMDEVGQEAARKVAQLFPPRKAKIVNLPLKDANDMLVANRASELQKALWDAKPYTPEGIISGEDIVSRLLDRKVVDSIPLPDYLPQLQEMTKGLRTGELVVITSGTGGGKTTLIKEIEYHIYNTTQFNQAIIHLEEPLEDTAEAFVSIKLNRRVHLDHELSRDIILNEAREIFGSNRIHLYDAFGSLAEEDLYSKIRYMVKGLDCKFIWLDHLSILVSDLDANSDERRTIDRIMHKLKELTIELDCFIGLVVHLNNDTKAQGKTFEEGARPTLNNLRGSGGIKQLANMVIATSRNQQAEDPIIRNTTNIDVLKCRYTGVTGRADKVYFDYQTGRLGKAPEEEPKETQIENKDF